MAPKHPAIFKPLFTKITKITAIPVSGKSVSKFSNENASPRKNIKYTITEIEKEGKTFYKIKNLTSNVEAESEFGIFQIDGIDYKYLKDSDDLVSLKLGVGLKMYKHNFFEAIGRAVPFTCEWAWQCLVLFGQLVTGQLGLHGVGGPITTISKISYFPYSIERCNNVLPSIED